MVLGRNSILYNYQTASIHSEDAAMNKMTRCNRFKRVIPFGAKIDLLVIRLSKTGVLGSSRPCQNCLKRLTKSKYPVDKVYYSNDKDTIVREKFDSMFDSPLTAMSSADRRSAKAVREGRTIRTACSVRASQRNNSNGKDEESDDENSSSSGDSSSSSGSSGRGCRTRRAQRDRSRSPRKKKSKSPKKR